MRRRICGPLIRSNFQSFATNVLKNVSAKKALLDALGRMLQKEVLSLCSTGSKSVLAEIPSKDLSGVVQKIISEMQARAPTLLLLLGRAMKTRRPRPNTSMMMAFITSMMCKHRKASVCLLQRLVSLILFHGHSTKQV